ncbi:unnamed protein product [Caenorhabditis angaria]|uniref:SGNH domain-containing protein n=1 Tax=Caenorhabditis angaria TaxID=860376 RepID=A0A9P1N6H0_9PELO|nr:unnamed protein product [Caenorhabditis angaria]
MLVYILSKSPVKSYKLLETVEEEFEKKASDNYFLINQIRCSMKPNSILSLALTFTLILITFNFHVLPQDIVRPLITFSTSGILLFSNGDDKFLSNKVLTYIGDISYSLYLIHWPVYSYWKLTKNGDVSSLIYCIILSTLFAIFIYHYFEKWYISLSYRNVLILIAIIFVGNLATLYHESIRKTFQGNTTDFSTLDGITDDMTLDDAEKLNADWTAHDYRNLIFDKCEYEDTKPIGWCKLTDFGNESRIVNQKSKYKIMVIGNSWAANHAKLIYQECGYKAKVMMIGAAHGCEPLYPSMNLEKCINNVTDFRRHVERFKPDYAIHITRHISYGLPFVKTGDFRNDPVYRFMWNQAKILLQHIKNKFFILNAFPRANATEVGQIVKYIRQNMTFVEIDKKLIDEHLLDNARDRYSQLVKDCGEKCELFDYLPKFYRNDTQTWRYFDDRGFSFFTGPNHLSYHGLEYVRGVIRGICEKM